jgi:predicted transcriptional regulator
MSTALTVFLIILGFVAYFLFIWGLVVWSKNRYHKQHLATQKDITDAELFRLMNQTNHFISVEQLVEVTGMDEKMAYKRLWFLAHQRVIRGYYSNGNMQDAVFQLPENVPLEAIPKMNVQQMSDKEVVKNILTYAQDYQVTVAELVVIFDLDIYEAQNLIKRLLKSKLVSRLRKGVQYIYIIDRSVQLQRSFSSPNKHEKNIRQNFEAAKKIKIPTTTSGDGRIKIPDAEVIQYAIENNGRITPTLLCLKSKISIEEAKLRLEELYEQGAFLMDVDESNYVMEYQLRDQSLLNR